MLLNKHDNNLETNAEFESKDFGIGDASVVIEILRNRLYKHKIRTLVQEYICNGRDACREANKPDNALEITMPNALNPVFKVRDYGVGIDPKRISEVFVMYGSSTKRKTNNQTGGFGIGAKSAWSYTDSFTVITYLDGVKRTYIAHTGVNNNGRLDFMGDSATKEANGTEIHVPVVPNDCRQFSEAIQRAIYYWNDQPKIKGLVAGDLLPKHETKLMLGNLEIDPKTRENLLVIDGIQYVLDYDLFSRIPKLYELTQLVENKIAIYLDNGNVEVGASREEIADSQTTINYLSDLSSRLIIKVENHIKDKYRTCNNIYDFVSVHSELTQLFNVNNDAHYSGYTIDRYSGLYHEKFKGLDLIRVTKSYRRSGRIKRQEVSSIKLDCFDKIYIVDGSEAKTISGRRINNELNGENAIYIVYAKTSDALALAQLKKDLKPKCVKTLELPPVDRLVSKGIMKAPIGKKEFSIKAFKNWSSYGSNGYSQEAITTNLDANTQKWLYIELDKASWPKKYSKAQLAELDKYLITHGDYRVCGLSGRSLKFVKGNENFTNLDDFLDSYVFSKEEIGTAKRRYAKLNYELSCINDASQIKDNSMREIIEQYAFFLQNKFNLPTIFENLLVETEEVKQFMIDDAAFKQIIKTKYPLLYSTNICYRGNIELNDEWIIYINAKNGEKNES